MQISRKRIVMYKRRLGGGENLGNSFDRAQLANVKDDAFSFCRCRNFGSNKNIRGGISATMHPLAQGSFQSRTFLLSIHLALALSSVHLDRSAIVVVEII